MPRPSWQLCFLILAAACGGGSSAASTGANTTETQTTGDSTGGDRCGDGVAAEGEVCFQVERRKAGITIGILLPGDFDGDGVREYYIDEGGLSGYYGILSEEPEPTVTRYDGFLADEYGMEHMVYRASARDIDLDGKTDLLTLMQYHFWSGHVGSGAFGGVVLRTQPGFEFSYELLLFWKSDYDFVNEVPNRFDGTFGDFDGDGIAELLFASNLHQASVFHVEPGAAEKELFKFDYALDLKPLALQDNIVTVAVDLDDDGRDDIILADGLGRVWTFHSDPGGYLTLQAFTETPVLPAMAGTVLAQDVDRDGIVDLVSAYTKRVAGELLPGEFAIARGLGDGRFEPLAAWTTTVGPTQNSSPWGPQLCYVHLGLIDLDGSGYPALVYALRDEQALVVHPQVGRTLGADPVVFPLDFKPAGVFLDPQDDGTVDLLVSLERDDNGTEDDSSDDIGPYIDRYRLDP